MSNDLISRSALKKDKAVRLIDANALRKEFAKSPWFAGENGAMLSYARTIIDKAPTISPYKAIHDELHKGEEE